MLDLLVHDDARSSTDGGVDDASWNTRFSVSRHPFANRPRRRPARFLHHFIRRISWTIRRQTISSFWTSSRESLASTPTFCSKNASHAIKVIYQFDCCFTQAARNRQRSRPKYLRFSMMWKNIGNSGEFLPPQTALGCPVMLETIVGQPIRYFTLVFSVIAAPGFF